MPMKHYFESADGVKPAPELARILASLEEGRNTDPKLLDQLTRGKLRQVNVSHRTQPEVEDRVDTASED